MSVDRERHLHKIRNTVEGAERAVQLGLRPCDGEKDLVVRGRRTVGDEASIGERKNSRPPIELWVSGYWNFTL